jgi:hypothetical protein
LQKSQNLFSHILQFSQNLFCNIQLFSQNLSVQKQRCRLFSLILSKFAPSRTMGAISNKIAKQFPVIDSLKNESIRSPSLLVLPKEGVRRSREGVAEDSILLPIKII